MYLSHLSLTNFRNIRELELDLPPRPVVLVGSNAQGKTSILEAIYLLAIAKSFHAENEREVVNWSAASELSHALVGGTVEREGDRLRVMVGYQCVPLSQAADGSREIQRAAYSVRKQITVSRVKRTAMELVGLINAVLFSADDLHLVQGSPAGRRRYLDILLSQMNPGYLRSLQRYQHVLHQRNQLLKLLQEKRAGQDELAFWDNELVKEGSWILRERCRALTLLGPLAEECHGELTSQGECFRLDYKSTVALPPALGEDGDDDNGVLQALQEGFTAALAESRVRERMVGSTLLGPHRDDLRLLVGGVDMGTYASRGQARTIALTLRLAEASYLTAKRGDGPIVLLDDVLSELDQSRRSHVLEKAATYQQVIISTTDLEPLGQDFLRRAACFRVLNGQVSPL